MTDSAKLPCTCRTCTYHAKADEKILALPADAQGFFVDMEMRLMQAEDSASYYRGKAETMKFALDLVRRDHFLTPHGGRRAGHEHCAICAALENIV